MAKKRVITLDDIKRDPQLASVVDGLEKKFNGSLPSEIVDSLIDTLTWADVIPKQASQWINDTCHIMEKILKNQASGSDHSLLWIRIYEIVNELPDYFQKYEDLFVSKSQGFDSAMVRHIEIGEDIRKLLLKIKSELSGDELILLEYERHCNAHIFQKGYRPKVKVKEHEASYKAKTDYKGMPLSQVNAIIEEEMKKYGGVDSKFQETILGKISGLLFEINKLVTQWSS